MLATLSDIEGGDFLQDLPHIEVAPDEPTPEHLPRQVVGRSGLLPLERTYLASRASTNVGFRHYMTVTDDRLGAVQRGSRLQTPAMTGHSRPAGSATCGHRQRGRQRAESASARNAGKIHTCQPTTQRGADQHHGAEGHCPIRGF